MRRYACPIGAAKKNPTGGAPAGVLRWQLLRQKYDVTDASVHDSQKFDGLLNQASTSADVYADSAYRSAETEAKLSLRALRNHAMILR
jgi:transposase, IS5 family